MLDPFYTPDDIAMRLVEYCRTTPHKVADFCAGDGGLLQACERRFPQARYTAVDKSKLAIRKLKATHSGWAVVNEDFLKSKRIRESGVRTSFYDLILMNPPFSCRGKLYKFNLDGQSFKGSKALLFIIRALQYLTGGGVLLAILPVGVTCTQRDEAVIKYLKACYDFTVLENLTGVSFKGKQPDVIFASMRRPQRLRRFVVSIEVKESPSYLQRGAFNVQRAKEVINDERGICYVHTTNLQEGRVLNAKRKAFSPKLKSVYGPAVLLPRVGIPTADKIVRIGSNEHFVLSDCVIAIRCKSEKGSKKLQEKIVLALQYLQGLYWGTGAKFITMHRLGVFIENLSVNSMLMR